MKRISLLLATAAVILGMMSCDKLKEPYIIEPIVEESDTIPLTPEDIANFDGKLVVLLEDYTGVKCNNCPAAAEIALQLQEQNEGHLVVLGVHPKTPLQNPAGGFPDFRTDDGHEWNTDFNIGAYPSGLVNRTGGVLGAAQWTTAVNSYMGAEAPVRLIVKTNYFDSDRTLQISVHSKFLQTIESNNVLLTVCMMEDSIVGKQTTPEGVVEDYMHRHVFRGTADGQTWGSILDINADYMEAGREFVTNMKFTLSDEYNADQFYIVAFISNNTTKEVLMAAETKIK
ncbi:MAG: Omp28 family outer membrane lipoprotein [Bacteroidales bacterium]|nr:Omp28 family outer membrane lipoprotein [Bacteroidales bacterium]